MRKIKELLDLLPFGGSKTKIGAILAVAAIVQQFVPGVDLVSTATQLLTEHLDLTAMLTLLTGTLHKILKNRLGEDE